MKIIASYLVERIKYETKIMKKKKPDMAKTNDREKLRLKGIESPNMEDMEYRYYDAQRKITYYFRSEERYLRFLKMNEIEPAERED